jgi:hypothetical protein
MKRVSPNIYVGLGENLKEVYAFSKEALYSDAMHLLSNSSWTIH